MQIRQIIKGTAAPLIVLIAWELASRLGFFSPTILPPPSEVAVKWWGYLAPLTAYDPGEGSYVNWVLSGELIHDTYSSMYRVVVGFLIGAGLALPMGLLMGASRSIHDLMNPLVQILRPIPPIAYIPLAILWFGLGNPPSFFLIAIGAYFPVLMNTIAGVRQVDSIYLRAAANLGASRWILFTRVILPAATPFILAGMRIGIGTAFIVVIVSEMIAVNEGLGFRILEAREFMWSAKIVAGMITIGLLGLAIDTAFSKLNNHLLRWHRGLES